MVHVFVLLVVDFICVNKVEEVLNKLILSFAFLQLANWAFIKLSHMLLLFYTDYYQWVYSTYESQTSLPFYHLNSLTQQTPSHVYTLAAMYGNDRRWRICYTTLQHQWGLAMCCPRWGICLLHSVWIANVGGHLCRGYCWCLPYTTAGRVTMLL